MKETKLQTVERIQALRRTFTESTPAFWVATALIDALTNPDAMNHSLELAEEFAASDLRIARPAAIVWTAEDEYDRQLSKSRDYGRPD